MRALPAVLAVVGLVGAGFAVAGLGRTLGAPVALRAEPGPLEAWRADGRGYLRVQGIPPAALRDARRWEPEDPRWRDVATVRVAGVEDAPPVVGGWRVEGAAARFDPAFPVLAGSEYHVEVRRASAPDTSLVVRWPGARVDARTRVTLHPTADTLPVNLLRFYLEFGAAMRPGDALTHVRLVDAAGEAVEDAFLAGGQELWDPEGNRFTLLLDPGRIKRGLRGNVEQGGALRTGETYTLVVDASWRDAAGAPLLAGAEKTFVVGAFDDAAPRPDGWDVTAPGAGTREPLRVRFGEPLDRAQAARMIAVAAAGTSVVGQAEVDREGRGWSFVPARPWARGEHRLVVDPALEDLAGNSPRRLFDADVARGERGVSNALDEQIEVLFRIR